MFKVVYVVGLPISGASYCASHPQGTILIPHKIRGPLCQPSFSGSPYCWQDVLHSMLLPQKQILGPWPQKSCRLYTFNTKSNNAINQLL